MEMFEFTMADNSVAVIIVTSAQAESNDKETPEYVLPGADEDKDEYEDSSDSEMNWEYYTGLRVVTMFNHKAIEASCEGERKYILALGPQAIELIGTEPSVGPQSYLAVKHTEDSDLIKECMQVHVYACLCARSTIMWLLLQ